MPVTDSSPASAVERALNILENVAHRRDGLTNSEISRKLAIPKARRATFCAPWNAAGTFAATRRQATTNWV
jgi:hypothetical protein